MALEAMRKIEPVLSSDAAVTSSEAESVVLPILSLPLLVSVPPMFRVVLSALVRIVVDVQGRCCPGWWRPFSFPPTRRRGRTNR